MMKKQNLFLFLLLFLGNMVLYAQGCSVNAGGNATICGTSYTLQGSTTGTPVGNPTWTLVSKPAGAPDPVISNINSYTPNVTGMTFPGNYVFQMAQSCSSGSGTSQVTIIAPGATTGFTAGPDITGIPAATGVANLNATIPAGYTPSWTYYNIFSYETNGAIVTTNATMSNSTTATPTLTLTNKADHTIDPAYRAVLRITSINNPNCWYEDDAIVRFIPNPNMLWPATSSVCVGPPLNATSFYYDPNGNSPKISTTTANSSGNPAFGTTVTMAVVSQPAGGNIQYSRMENGRLYFSGIPATATGSYVFDLTIANSLGSYTTRLTYIFNGLQPGALSFVDPAYPNQVELYSFGGSAGSVHCNMVGSTAPITFYYKLNAADSPSLPSTITPVTVIPTGGAPSYVQGGAGTANRSVTLTPPSGGWRAGTYKFTVQVTGGSGCIRTHYYFVHISDNARPAVNVDNITVCYPGSGVVSATVPLPASYIAPASNPSYLQDFGGRYDFTLISGPAGAAVPTYQGTSLRSLTSTSTVISNLDKTGEYVFRIKSAGASGPQKIIDAEYACSGTSPEDTFSVFVSPQINSNAGSDQTLTGGTTQTILNGNNPGVSSGTWTLVSKPSGAADPVIVTPSAYNSNVTGLNGTGTYTFRWTIATGTCTSTDDVNITATANNCVNGCNPNTFVNAVDPNTIEYDNIVSTFHSTIIKESNGTFKVWGEETAPDGTGDLLSPTAITPANGFNYTGTPLKATGGSGVVSGDPAHQHALLTTDGLYVWGNPNQLISSSIKSTNAFGKITVNGKSDGLPPGVIPGQVKMMFGSYQTLGIVTCSGEAWVLSLTGAKNGDGTADSAANNVIWHRVKTSAAGNPTLDNVVAMRGNFRALFALTSDGNLYTWGSGTYINSGASADRTYATQVTVPAGVTPKMIGMPAGRTATAQAYYLLATDGRLFSMGNNDVKQLGDGTSTERTTWVQPKKVTNQSGQGTGTLTNIAWISPNEHAYYSGYAICAINVLTNDRKQWAWGVNDNYMIGGAVAGTASYYDPIYMPGSSTAANGMKVTDEIIAVETGGHTTMNIKKGSDKFGYVGHYVHGSMGNGISTDSQVPTYSYQTAIVTVCAAEVGPAVQDLTICNGTTANLNDANLATVPSEVEWHATNDASSPVITNITAVAQGTYYAFYTVASGKQRIVGSAAIVTGVVCCPAGCNPNTFVNAVDPNTIEYDAMVSGYHSTIVKEADGTFKAWGQETSPNGTGDLLSPTAITSANGFSYIGTPLKATTGSGSDGVTIRHQHALLTTDGLYVWGVNNMLISSSIKNTTAFGKISVNGKTDGLPAGVTPQQVKMMFGSFQTLGIVTCSGEAWVLSMTGDKNGDGSIQNSGTPNSNTVWHRVRTSVAGNPTLDNVVAMRGTANALFALTSDSKLYTWGTGTYINSGGATNRTYATEVSVPAGATPKMIGMTEAGTAQSYYLLATNGKLYTMGDNSSRQLGDGTTAAKNTWVQPLKVTDQSGQGIGVLENIAWISPNEHSRYPTTTAGINVLTNNYKQWAWGYNDNYMLGGASPSSAYDPIYMPGTSAAANGLKVTDELIAVETGGHTSMNIKKGSDKFGYVGHRTNGSMGDGSTANEYIPTYSYQTAIVTVCGAPTSSFCYKPGITAGTALDTKVGISSLGRAGATDADNWPMIRKGGHIALEAKTKAFVPNRVAFDASGNPVGIVAANFVEGMVVYDTTNKCLKMYTSKDNGVSFGWYCITTQTCPD